ncbi:hypothetical protein Tco_0552189 [Tanacetum coccineum]
MTNVDPPVIEAWASDSDDVQPVKAKENAFVESDNNDPSKNQGAIGVTPLANTVKGKPTVNNDFYHEPFLSKESEKDVRDLVASSFTKRIRDYDMPEKLRAYDGTTDPNDHLTVFMGTRKYRWFPPIKGQIQGKLFVATKIPENPGRNPRAFISGLRQRCLFKDLIAKPATSLEDFMENPLMDEDDEISNLVDLHIYMLYGGWKWQDLLRLALVDHHRREGKM